MQTGLLVDSGGRYWIGIGIGECNPQLTILTARATSRRRTMKELCRSNVRVLETA